MGCLHQMFLLDIVLLRLLHRICQLPFAMHCDHAGPSWGQVLRLIIKGEDWEGLEVQLSLGTAAPGGSLGNIFLSFPQTFPETETQQLYI